MTSKLIVNSLAADTGVSTITFADQAKMGNSLFHSTGFTIGDSFLHSTGVNLTNVNATGVITATKFVGEVSVGSSITFEDNEKAYFGTSTDFSIYHNGSASYLDETGTGGLIVKTDTAFQVFNSAGSQAALTVTPGGAVELYHNNSKKFETMSYGAKWTGILLGADNQKLELGSSGDLSLYHDGTNSYIDNVNTGILRIRGGAGGSGRDIQIQAKNGEYSINAIPNGAVELYHDNVKQVQTTADGVGFVNNCTFSDNKKIQMGNNNDLQIYHQSSDNNSYIKETAGGSLVINADDFYLQNNATTTFLRTHSSGATDLNYGGNIKLATTSYGVNVTGTLIADKLQVNDGEHVSLGNDNDLRLYFDGSNSAWNNSTGNNYFYGGGGNFFFRPVNAEQALNVIANGAVELYHNNQKRIETTTAGATITGNLAFASGNGIDFSVTSDGGTVASGGEVLDDYEEGTFTPTFYYVSGTSGVSYTTQEGRYTKIGRLVSIHIKMSVSNIGSGNNNMRVGGLPFAPVNSGVSYDYFNFSAVVGMNIGSGRVPFAQLEDYNGGGRITMYSFDYSSNSNYSEINSSHLSNGLNFGMTGTYVTS